MPVISSITTPSPRPARAAWEQLGNGELLAAAEAAGFEVLITTDRNLRYQQNLAARKIAVVILGQGRWSAIERHVAQVVAAVNAAGPGTYTEWIFPSTDPSQERSVEVVLAQQFHV